jgi:hypothetical protein
MPVNIYNIIEWYHGGFSNDCNNNDDGGFEVGAGRKRVSRNFVYYF